MGRIVDSHRTISGRMISWALLVVPAASAGCAGSPPAQPCASPSVRAPCPVCPAAAATPTTTALIPIPREADREPKNGRFACSWSGEVRKPNLTYHVSPTGNDSNNGTTNQTAFATLQRAADAVRPGDTVLVHTGTYTGKLGGDSVLRIYTSGTEQAPIVFKAADGEHPVIQNNCWQAIHVVDASYIVIEGFELIGQGKELSLDFAMAHKADKTRWDTNAAGIQLWNYETGGHSHHIIVRNNRIHDFGGHGVVGSECDCITVAENTVYSNGFYSLWGGYGILFWQPRPLVQAAGYKMVIRGNRIFDIWNYVPYVDAAGVTEPLTGGALMLDLLTKHGYAGPVLVEGNIIYRNQGCGIQNYEGLNVDVMHNTLFENLLDSGVDWGEYCDFRTHGSRVMNNVFVAGKGHRATFVKSTIPDAVFDNNLYWPEGAGLDKKGPNDRYGDPRFVSTSGKSVNGHTGEEGWDFHLGKDSAAIDAADLKFTPPLDADGRKRYADGKPDLGAFER